MYILKDNQVLGRYFGGYEPVIFETLEEVEEVLRELIEIKKGLEKENLKEEGK